MQTSTPLTDKQMKTWAAHVLSVYPNEACAFIVGGIVRPVPNVSDTPTTNFSVDAATRLGFKGKITGFLHSHPCSTVDAGNRPFPIYWPSTHDMQSWLADDIRWGISATEGENVTQPVWLDNDYTAPLVGRHFIHGIHDCYAAVRDYYKQELGITLKNYARGMEWWYDGKSNLYEDNFIEAGFIEIPESEVRPNDLVLMRIGSRDVISHAAVVVDSNTLYHHTFSRTGQSLSGNVDMARWQKHFAKYLRYVGSGN